MRFIAVFGVLVLLLTGAARAEPGAIIMEAAQECINLPPSLLEIPFTAVIDAVVAEDGIAKFRIFSYEPDTPRGKIIADALLRSLLRCAPYDVPAGGYRFDSFYVDPFAGIGD